MYGHLIPVGGGQALSLQSRKLIIGRHPRCDLTVSSKSVSGRHCELRMVDGYWWVRDLDSQNGTGVNGRRCITKRLMPDDTLHVARMRFKVVYVVPQSSGAATEEDLALRLLGSDPVTSESPSQPSGRDPDRSEPQRPAGHSVSPAIPMADARPAAVSPSDKSTRPLPAAANSSAAKPSRRFLGKLVPCGGGDLLPLLQEILTIGRSRDCELRIKSATVSSKHCRLQLLDGFWTIEDLNSSNGVQVDGKRVRQKVLLPGCTLSVAKHRYTVEYAPEGTLAPDVDVPYVAGSADGSPISGSLLESIGLNQDVLAEKPPAWLVHAEEPQEKAKYRLDDYDP